MALPCATTGSLRPTFVPDRDVSLTVRLPYAFTLNGWFPISLREPSRASVTLWEATAPVKLPTRHCPSPGLRVEVRIQKPQGWYFKVGSTETSVPASKPPTYPTHAWPRPNIRLQSRCTGSFCPVAGKRHLHRCYSFAELLQETAVKSLHHSCRSELTRQGISLP